MKLNKPKPFPEFGTYCKFFDRRIYKEEGCDGLMFNDGHDYYIARYEPYHQLLAVNENTINKYDHLYTRETTLELIKDSISETFNLTIVEAY